jgi:hypothetical protein
LNSVIILSWTLASPEEASIECSSLAIQIGKARKTKPLYLQGLPRKKNKKRKKEKISDY